MPFGSYSVALYRAFSPDEPSGDIKDVATFQGSGGRPAWLHWGPRRYTQGGCLAAVRRHGAYLYSMDRRTSVVIIKQLASGLICTSPVSRPTSNFLPRSLNFWLLIAFTGAV